MAVIRVIMSLLIMVVPVLAVLLELVTRFDIVERHHIHHDTYAVSLVVTRTIMLVNGFMGVLGLLVSWLCRVGIYGQVEPVLTMSFFLSFELALLIAQSVVGRYQVVTYEDHLTVTPFVGATRSMRYADITQMRYRQRFPGGFVTDLHLTAKDGSHVSIWGILDIDQMLLRIDRFEVLEV